MRAGVSKRKLAIGLLATSTSLCGVAVELDVDPRSDVVGQLRTVSANSEDTLASLAQRHGLGYQEIVLANPDIDRWLPDDGREVILPLQFVLPNAPRTGIVINLAEMRLYHFGTEAVDSYPIGIGRDEFPTPLGLTRVVAHISNPSWTPPESIRAEHRARGNELPPIVPPGPDNPLGSLAIMLDLPGYLIHGTNRPFGIGQPVSHGCIRLYDHDVQALAKSTRNGTQVRIVDQPFKAGTHGEAIFAEAHPRRKARRKTSQNEGHTLTDAVASLIRVSEATGLQIDWSRAQDVLEQADGIPRRVSVLP